MPVHSAVSAVCIERLSEQGRTSVAYRRVMLVNGRAKAAQIYPPALVAAILKGIKEQMKEDGEIKDLGNS